MRKALVHIHLACRFITLGIALFFLFVGKTCLASSGPGTESASFLDIPIGAAPASLGSAYTARATDAYAPVWNPAGLGFTDGVHLSATHLLYLENIHYDYIGTAIPLPHHFGLGVSAQYLGSGNIPQADESGNITGSFTSDFAAYSLALGQAVTDRLALGLTGKIIRENIADVSAQASAADAGLMFKMTDQITLAATIANMGNSVKLVSEKDSLPLAYRAGALVQLLPTLNISGEVVYRNTGLFSGSGGVQWECDKVIVVRGGIDTRHTRGLTAASAFTAGVGIHAFGQELAYAWVPYSDLGSTHYFSLDFRFGGSEEEPKRGLLKVETVEKGMDIDSDYSARGSDDYQLLDGVLSGAEQKALESGTQHSKAKGK